MTRLAPEAIVDPRSFTDERALHALLEDLRGRGDLVWLEPEGFEPFWLATSHAAIMAVERDAGRFINQPRQALFSREHQERSLASAGGRRHDEIMRNLTGMDGDEHRRYRELTQAYFTPKGLEGMMASIEALARDAVDRMAAAGGECDFAEIAMSFPLRVIVALLGLPAEDEPRLLDLAQRALSNQDPEFRRNGGNSIDAMVGMMAYFQSIIARLREQPDDTFASVIANARVDGELLPDRDAFGYVFIVATAGHDTTSYALTGGINALLRHPDQLARLQADLSLMPVAIEEILRWTTPVKHFCRTATEDCEVLGASVRKGDIVMLGYPSANFDGTLFDDPFRFRIDRKPNRQLAFGTGPHVCLGQYLARYELSVFLRELLTRVEHIELAGEARFVEGTFVGGVKKLPVRYRMR